MEITLAFSPKVNSYISDKTKVAKYYATYVNFQKHVQALKCKAKKLIIIKERHMVMLLLL